MKKPQTIEERKTRLKELFNADMFSSEQYDIRTEALELTNSIIQSLQDEKAGMMREVQKLVILENYKLEEWYGSADRPREIEVFQANQRNIKTRNETVKGLYEIAQKYGVDISK